MIRIAVPGIRNFYRGGTSTFVYMIGTFLCENIKFDYMSFRLPSEKKYVDQIEKNGGSFTVLNNCRIPLISTIINFFTLYNHLKKNKYILCYINVQNAFEMLYLSLAALFSGIPVRIGHSHNSGINAKGKKYIKKYILHILSKLLLPLVTTDYLSCSDKASVWMYSSYIRKKKRIVKINNPVDIKKFIFDEMMRGDKRSNLKISNNLVIGNVAQFVYQKNHIFILMIFREVLKIKKDAILFLIGQGPLYIEIKKKAVELDIINNIVFLDFTPNIYEYMQVFDVFLLPSRFEGLPIVGIEAQSTGLPCFFSDSITKEVNVTNNCFFLSLKEKPEVWARSIIESLQSFERKDCSDLVKKAGYDIKESADKIEKIFTELYNRHNK